MKTYTGLNWLRVGPRAGMHKHGKEISGAGDGN